MRKYGIEKPYEKLKALTRGRRISAAEISEFVDSLKLAPEVRDQLKQLSPLNYVGKAAEFVDRLQ